MFCLRRKTRKFKPPPVYEPSSTIKTIVIRPIIRTDPDETKPTIVNDSLPNEQNSNGTETQQNLQKEDDSQRQSEKPSEVPKLTVDGNVSFENKTYTDTVKEAIRNSLGSESATKGDVANNENQRNSSEQINKVSKSTITSELSVVEGITIKRKSSGSIAESRRIGVNTIPLNYDENAVQKIPKHPKDLNDTKLLKEAFCRNEFLKQVVKDDLLQDIVDAMYKREIKAKEVIIREGEYGSHLYVSATGKYEISVKTKGVVDVFDDVRVFGELAILYNDKRKATIRALKAGRIWVLDQTVYQQLIIHHNIQEQDETLNFLQKIPKLNKIGPDALQKVATLLKREIFTPGQEIVREGDQGDKFYIIRIGTVTITKANEGIVATLEPEQYFGELGLLLNDRRQATVIADSPGVECLTLNRQDFLDHFGDVEDISSISVQPVKKIEKQDENTNEYNNINLNDLITLKTIGVGGFGRVELVQHKKRPEQVFALKYLKKYDMVEQNQQEHVYNEKNLQTPARSIFIVRLYKTFTTPKYIHFLMEVCLGGDLWTLLRRQKNRRFDESGARFIAACVLEALSYLHERNIVYRDLKPENLLIDSDGYIKLTDFGFAKQLGSRGRTFTFAGTPEYVAPEIVLNRGHDKSVDYWAFGAFIFELLTGRTPFYTNDPTHIRTYNKILAGIDNVNFPSYVTYKARNIIEKLCKPLPTERLGCQKNGIDDIRNAKWFMGFPWNKLNEKQIQSPFKPKLKSPTDTTHFDDFKEDKDTPPDETSGWDKNL